jgi:DNA-formamidopyrimidine glycosylase
MPEGPEVSNFIRSINSFLSEGDQLLSVIPLSGRYTKSPLVGLENVQFPLTIDAILCKGKFIYWTFRDTDVVLFNTLGMSGAWSQTPRNERVKFVTSEGDLYFNDARNFGTLKFTDREELVEKLGSLGPDMLNENVMSKEFIGRLRRRPDATLAEVLMDQGIISGVGNYLKADSLWLARLSPWRKVAETTDTQLTDLWMAVRTTIRDAYVSGGSTILTYKGFEGNVGKYQMLAYGRKTDSRGNEIISEETPDGRKTWWAPDFQT